MKNWSKEMEELYDQVARGEVSYEKADTLANVCGKALKYEALQFAREVFAENIRKRGGQALPAPDVVSVTAIERSAEH